MVVFSMNSKRLRRPNVRLWEIGDLSAAFACSVSSRNKEHLGQNQWMSDPLVQESEYLESYGPKKSEYIVSDHGVSAKILDDILQNRENNDPNSLKSVSQITKSVNRCKLDFGAITRKSRLMRRRRQNPNSTCSLFGHPSPTANTASGMYRANGIEDSYEHETSSTMKQACEFQIDDHNFSMGMPQKPIEFGSKDASYEDNTGFTQSTNGINKMINWDSNENGVKEWLEAVGFGNFAELFEIHEVSEDVLPLLTFEDLKEMGISAVGPRRKLFTAIQQLKGSQ